MPPYKSLPPVNGFDRRDFIKVGTVAGAGLVLTARSLLAAQQSPMPQEKPSTNIQDALAVPRTATSLPGPCPGRVIEVADEEAMADGRPNAAVVNDMFDRGIQELTGRDMQGSFDLLFSRDDIVGLKVNPVGPGLISTRLEVVDATIEWLENAGLPRSNIIIWDRFDYMLEDAGFTADRYPGVGIEGLQTMDEAAATGDTDDNSKWLNEDGTHVSAPNFDQEVFYWADVDGPKDMPYLNQHVFNGKHSYFGNLLTKRLTKFINMPVFKNTGNAISMATKNIGYGAVCNTNRLHRPLFLDVCTEVPAFPPVRDKMVLNINDGLRSQYDGGPGANAAFAYVDNRLYFATDPFAMDTVCHNRLVAKRKEMEVTVNEHPRFTEYLRYAERLGLGVVDPDRVDHVTV